MRPDALCSECNEAVLARLWCLACVAVRRFSHRKIRSHKFTFPFGLKTGCVNHTVPHRHGRSSPKPDMKGPPRSAKSGHHHPTNASPLSGHEPVLRNAVALSGVQERPARRRTCRHIPWSTDALFRMLSCAASARPLPVPELLTRPECRSERMRSATRKSPPLRSHSKVWPANNDVFTAPQRAKDYQLTPVPRLIVATLVVILFQYTFVLWRFG